MSNPPDKLCAAFGKVPREEIQNPDNDIPPHHEERADGDAGEGGDRDPHSRLFEPGEGLREGTRVDQRYEGDHNQERNDVENPLHEERTERRAAGDALELSDGVGADNLADLRQKIINKISDREGREQIAELQLPFNRAKEIFPPPCAEQVAQDKRRHHRQRPPVVRA